MKIILTKEHFERGGHRYNNCPIYHYLAEQGYTEIAVLCEAAYYNLNGFRWKIKFSDDGVKFLLNWDKYEIIPELPYTLITDFPEKSPGYEE